MKAEVDPCEMVMCPNESFQIIHNNLLRLEIGTSGVINRYQSIAPHD